MVVISSPPLVVMATLVMLGRLDLVSFLVAYFFILAGSALFVWPFLASMRHYALRL